MQTCARHLTGCLLSLAAHAALYLMLADSLGEQHSLGSSARMPASFVTVHLLDYAGAPPASKAVDAAMALPSEQHQPPIPEPSRDSAYFPAAELTEAPRLLSDFRVDMERALRELATQSLIMCIRIDEQGNVDSITLEDAQLSNEAGHRLIEIVSQFKFQPGRISSGRVKSELKLRGSPESIVPLW